MDGRPGSYSDQRVARRARKAGRAKTRAAASSTPASGRRPRDREPVSRASSSISTGSSWTPRSGGMRCAATFAAEHDRSWTADDQAAVMGANSAAWARTMRERLDLDLPDAEIERAIVDGVVARYRGEGAPLIDGAVEAVRRIAADHPVAVASSAHRAVIDAALEATGLGGDIRGRRVVRRGRPRQARARRLSRGCPATRVRAGPMPRRRGFAQRGACREGCRDDRRPRARIGACRPPPGTAELADLVLERLADLDARSQSTEPGSVTETARRRASRAERQPVAPDDPLLGGADRRVSILTRAYLRVRLAEAHALPPDRPSTASTT